MTMWDSTLGGTEGNQPTWWDAPLVAKQEYAGWFWLVYLIPVAAVIGLLLWLFTY